MSLYLHSQLTTALFPYFSYRVLESISLGPSGSVGILPSGSGQLWPQSFYSLKSTVVSATTFGGHKNTVHIRFFLRPAAMSGTNLRSFSDASAPHTGVPHTSTVIHCLTHNVSFGSRLCKRSNIPYNFFSLGRVFHLDRLPS